MGIADLWPILPLDERVSFPVFLARFIKKHARPPRFAIDAYMFMFWSLVNTDNHDPIAERYDIRNFMAKLWYLVQNNVSFVVVLDGRYKPGKLRHGHIPEIPDSCSYDEALRYFLKAHSESYSEGLGMIENLKRILSRNRMDWVQAPGEAEAECAWLQRLGVVDYVISNDSDTMVFGATGVLRWFNRVKNYDEDSEPVKSSTDYYVTPVHMSRITEITNLTRNHLVMIAVLRGGDYSKGAESIGITRAKEIALCGTTMLQNSPRKTQQDFGSFPDVTSMFVNTFLDPEKSKLTLPYPFFGIKLELDRSESLIAFNEFFNEFLIMRGKDVFGRATSFKSKIKIDDYYAMLYFFPFVNHRIYKFFPHSTTFGEPSSVTQDLMAVNIDSIIPRINLVLSSRIIGKLHIKNKTQTFDGCVNLNFANMPLPRERKYNLKAFVLKFLREEEFWKHIQFSRIREFEGIDLAVLKFSRVKLNEYVYYTRKDLALDLDPESDQKDDQDEAAIMDNDGENLALSEPLEDDQKMMSVAIPLEAVSYVSSDYVRKFRHQVQRRSPLKKKASPQKTTLDSLWPKMGTQIPRPPSFNQHEYSPTPSKQVGDRKLEIPSTIIDLDLDFDSNPFRDHKTPEFKAPSGKGNFSKQGSPSSSKPTTKGLPRRRKGHRQELLPGQSTLTSFLQSKRNGISVQQPLFVISDDETEDSHELYLNMKKSFTFGPDLCQPVAKAEETCSLQELSPTKRHRMRMELSPETSPLKSRREAKSP